LRSELHQRWSSENLGRSGERRTAEALLDDPVVLDIPIGKKAEHHERCREKTEQGNAQHGIVGQQAAFPAAFSSLAAASKYRDFQLNGHEESWAPTKSNSQRRAIRSSKTGFLSSGASWLILNHNAPPTGIRVVSQCGSTSIVPGGRQIPS